MFRSLRYIALSLVIPIAWSAAAHGQTAGFDDIAVPTDPTLAPAAGGELLDAAAGYNTSGGTPVNPAYTTSSYDDGFGDVTNTYTSAFTSGGVQFPNIYNSYDYNGYTGNYWSGWVVSSASGVTVPVPDPTTAATTNYDFMPQFEYAAYTVGAQTLSGGGAGGSANYGVFYDDGVPSDETVTLPAGASPKSIDITNTVYTALSVTYGDAFSPPFNSSLTSQLGANPYLTLTITGLNGEGDPIGSITKDLAQYTSAGGLQVLNTWTYVDLSSLVGAAQLQFTMNTDVINGGGPTVPFYFAADNLVLATPEPSSLVLVLIGTACAAAAMIRRRMRRSAG